MNFEDLLPNIEKLFNFAKVDLQTIHLAISCALLLLIRNRDFWGEESMFQKY